MQRQVYSRETLLKTVNYNFKIIKIEDKGVRFAQKTKKAVIKLPFLLGILFMLTAVNFLLPNQEFHHQR